MILQRSRTVRGFSLIELGIVIAAIAVLASIVLMGSGYLNAARSRNAIEMVATLRQAAKQFAARRNGGLYFYNPAYVGSHPAEWTRVSIKTLNDEKLLNTPDGRTLDAPWEGKKAGIDPATTVDDARCSGYTCVKVCIETPAENGCTTCDDIRQQFERNSIKTACSPTGCGLVGSTCILNVVSR